MKSEHDISDGFLLKIAQPIRTKADTFTLLPRYVLFKQGDIIQTHFMSIHVSTRVDRCTQNGIKLFFLLFFGAYYIH